MNAASPIYTSKLARQAGYLRCQATRQVFAHVVGKKKRRPDLRHSHGPKYRTSRDAVVCAHFYRGAGRLAELRIAPPNLWSINYAPSSPPPTCIPQNPLQPAFPILM